MGVQQKPAARSPRENGGGGSAVKAALKAAPKAEAATAPPVAPANLAQVGSTESPTAAAKQNIGEVKVAGLTKAAGVPDQQESRRKRTSMQF